MDKTQHQISEITYEQDAGDCVAIIEIDGEVYESTGHDRDDAKAQLVGALFEYMYQGDAARAALKTLGEDV